METTITTKDRDQDVKGKTLGMCMVCFGGSTTQVIHDGTAENPKRNDGCKFTMCWDCWYRAYGPGRRAKRRILQSALGVGSLCYRVTFGKSNEPEVAYLRSFEAINDDTVLKMAAENRMQALKKAMVAASLNINVCLQSR